jgi:hypothetical protein
MNKPIRKQASLPHTFECGQVWQMADSSLRIGLVGKRLVHYKHYNLKIKRPSVLLSNKAVLERFLQERQAVLLPEAPPLATTHPKPIQPGRKPSRTALAKAP